MKGFSGDAQGSHFFILRLENKSGGKAGSWGLATPAKGKTRYDMLRDIFDSAVNERPELADFAIVGFDIQPNKL